MLGARAASPLPAAPERSLMGTVAETATTDEARKQSGQVQMDHLAKNIDLSAVTFRDEGQ